MSLLLPTLLVLAAGCSEGAPAASAPAPAPVVAPAPAPTPAPPATPTTAFTCCADDTASAVVAAYLDTTASLAKDDNAAAGTHLLELDTRLAAADATAAEADKAALAAMRKDAASAAAAPGVVERREALKKLSAAMIPYARAHTGGARTITEAWCPMASAGWLQEGGTIANPYYGAEMLTCGSFK